MPGVVSYGMNTSPVPCDSTPLRSHPADVVAVETHYLLLPSLLQKYKTTVYHICDLPAYCNNQYAAEFLQRTFKMVDALKALQLFTRQLQKLKRPSSLECKATAVLDRLFRRPPAARAMR